MSSFLRWPAVMIGVALFAAPAAAQIFGIRQTYAGPYIGPYTSGPYVGPYYAPLRYGSPWQAVRALHRIPMVQVQQREIVVPRQVPPPPAVTDIKVGIDGTSKFSPDIAAAIAKNRRILDPEKAPKPGEPADRDAALVQIKQAFDKEKGLPEMANLISKLALAEKSGVAQEFASALNQSEKAKSIPQTIAAIRQYLGFATELPNMSPLEVRAAIGDILKNLK